MYMITQLVYLSNVVLSKPVLCVYDPCCSACAGLEVPKSPHQQWMEPMKARYPCENLAGGLRPAAVHIFFSHSPGLRSAEEEPVVHSSSIVQKSHQPYRGAVQRE